MRLLAAAAFILALGAAGSAGAQSEHDAHSEPEGHAAEIPMPAGSDTADAISDARRAYEEAFDRMHGPMIEGVADEDPDVAFVRGMIPHHQGAIDMARIVQQYGDDEQIRALAARIIAAQEEEIREMEEWLQAHGR